MLNQIISQG